MDEKKSPATIDEYIALYPEEVRARMSRLRQVIREAAPEAQEKISWQMPTFVLHGNLIHFAAFKSHIGIYPAPTGILAFEDELAQYPKSKGAIQFPHGKPIPYELIGRIVRYRAEENTREAEAKTAAKAAAKAAKQQKRTSQADPV